MGKGVKGVVWGRGGEGREEGGGVRAEEAEEGLLNNLVGRLEQNHCCFTRKVTQKPMAAMS